MRRYLVQREVCNIADALGLKRKGSKPFNRRDIHTWEREGVFPPPEVRTKENLCLYDITQIVPALIKLANRLGRQLTIMEVTTAIKYVLDSSGETNRQLLELRDILKDL